MSIHNKIMFLDYTLPKQCLLSINLSVIWLYYRNTRIGGSRDDIMLRFKAVQPDGLLLWSAEDYVVTNVSDYLAVGLRSGKLVFSFNVGSGELVLTDTSRRLDDGQWHTVQLQRFVRCNILINSSVLNR